MESFLSQLKLIDNGTKWHKVDLHIHTPESREYKDKKVSYEAIMETAKSARLDMIAITDHNTGAGIDQAKQAAKTTDLVLLPGVEIEVEGIHVLGIFSESSTADDIKYVLHNLKIKDKDMGKKETISDVELSIPQVLREITRAGGIPIIAHTDSSKGLTKEIKGMWRTKLIQHETLKVLEITKNETKKFFDGTDPYYQRKLACIKNSDAHSLEEIGRRATWIKMGECNFRGLKQIIHEPDLRISLAEPRPEPYPRIIGMDVSGGLYKDDIFHFNNNLNCIIGGRGAGKSAIIDFIRFALDSPPRTSEFLREFNQRIVNLLGVGNSVRLCVDSGDGKYIIERYLLDFATERVSGKEERVTEMFSEEAIYQMIDGQVVEVSKPVWEIFDIEVFGQGEVFELTRRADDQLKLIDEYIGAEELFQQEKDLIGDLGTNSKEIIGLQEREAALAEKLKARTELKEKIRKLEGQLKADIFKNHVLWQAEKRYFAEVRSNLQLERNSIQDNINETVIPELPEIDEKSPNIGAVKEVSELFAELFRSLLTSRQNELALIDKTTGKINSKFIAWKREFDVHEEKFKDKLAELGVSSYKALAEQLNSFKTQEFNLEKKVLPQYQTATKELRRVQGERRQLLASLETTQKEVREKRLKVVKEMSGELEKGDVKIKINPGANRKKFFGLLDEIYAGSDIYRRKEQLQKICLSTTPLELVDLILGEKEDKLVELCGITDDTARKIVRTPSYEELHRLQVCPLQDQLAVYLKKAKGEDFSPLKDLSYGEKCTAIFSIALLGKKKPLLVDQPEDELDHAFVIDNIVEHIRGVKEKRQLLVSTHNANIPVLGDAELIFKVTKVAGEDKCTVEEQGAFEKESIIEKLQGLEGGPEAFRRRREKYGI